MSPKPVLSLRKPPTAANVDAFVTGGAEPAPMLPVIVEELSTAPALAPVTTIQREGRGGGSPVKQCGDYLKEAGARLYGNEPVQPTWGIVTDMNEFRLYWLARSSYARATSVRCDGQACA